MYHNAKELLALIGDSGKSIADIVIENEMEISEISREAIMDELQRRYEIMYKACHDGLETAVISISGLTGGTGKQMWDFIKSGKGIQDLTTQKGIAYALSCSEVNASMGLIVAAPTAGSSGVIPGVLCTIQEEYGFSDEEIVQALFNAGGIGYLITRNATTAGAEGGCQAEVGSASAMAASAVVELMGGTPRQCMDAASLAIVNILGLVCDPIGGLVENPCQNRNAMGASNALVAAELVLAGIKSITPIDETIEVMYAVGKSLPSELRETSMGGLAIAKSACETCRACAEKRKKNE